jgi:hypothetical protein
MVICEGNSAMQFSYAGRGAIWAILDLFFVLGPLFALLGGPLPQARDFWTEFSVAIAYVGLAMMGLQFGLTGYPSASISCSSLCKEYI